MKFTEDSFEYDDAIAMQRWLVDAIQTETCQMRVSVNPLRIKGHPLHREFEDNTGSRNLHDYGNVPQMKAYTQTSRCRKSQVNIVSCRYQIGPRKVFGPKCMCGEAIAQVPPKFV